MEQNKLIPLAILGAGVLIAISVFFVGRSSTDSVNKPVSKNDTGSLSAVRPVEEGDHIRGNPNAPVVLVEYSDFECPFCQRFHSDLQNVMETKGKTGEFAWVYRHFPLEQLHSKAPYVSLASECVAKLGGTDAFWAFADEYYRVTPTNNQVDLAILPGLATKTGVNKESYNTCVNEGALKADVEKDFAEAVAAGGRGTPFSVFIFREKMNDGVKQLADTLNTQYGDQLFTVLSENQLAMSGALPADAVKLVIDTQNGTVAQ